jgi:two-component system, OmpR family, sensor histidine kinase TctE
MGILSLQRKMQLALILPLCLILALSSALALFLTMHFVRVVHDRWLDDSVNSLAEVIVSGPTGASLELSEATGKVFRWDAQDLTWYRLESPTRGTIAGSRFVPLAGKSYDRAGSSLAYDGVIEGQPVRVARLDLPVARFGEPLSLAVAETVRKRTHAAHEVAWAVLAPQALLAIVAALLLLATVKRTIQPLQVMASRLNAQSLLSLDPLPLADTPPEVQPLVTALNEMLARLGSVIRSKQHFLATAAHDLRTPLAAALLHLERVRGADAASAASLSTALAAMRRASRATQQVLSLAHAEFAAVDPAAMGRVDLCEVVQQIGAELAPAAAAKGHTLSLDVCREHLAVRGNHDLLAIAVSNLLDNAIRYTPAGGRIEVQVFDDQGVGVRITNSGSARPAHAPPDVLASTSADPPTRRASESGSVGTGLGLAIAREVAARHRGKLDFTAGVHEESVATLWLADGLT